MDIGHNSGSGIDLDILLDPDVLISQWEMDNEEGIARRDALVERVKRFKTEHPNGVQTEEEAAEAGDIVAAVNEAAKDALARHKMEKAPYWNAGLAADRFFKGGWADALLAEVPYFLGSGVRGEPLGVTTRYQRAKAERERLAREEAARKAHEEAQRAAEAARRATTSDVVDNALAKQDEADNAQSAAKASDADLSRTRGAYGSVQSLRTNWVYEVTDLRALLQAALDGKIPLNYVQENDKLLGALIRPKDSPVRDVPGLKIWNAAKTGVRT